jgi:hypothetical protein
MRDDDLREAAPQAADDDAIEAALRGDDTAPPRASLTEDILSLVEDGKTYAEAELNFQKSRISFVAHRSKSAALYVTFALGFVHLALVALVIGGLLALTPAIGALGATVLVVGILLGVAAILVLLARTRARDVADAFKENGA